MRFEDALRDYGLERCSLAGQTLLIGLGPQQDARAPVDRLPDAATRFVFCEGPRQAALIARFLESDAVTNAEMLFIGTSHDYARLSPPEGYDFREAVATLEGGRYPSIRTLSLGDMELLFNGHRYFGSLGDVAPVFDALPNLEDLELQGNFELSRPVSHDRIGAIGVWVDEVGVTGGRLSRATVTNLLSSRFARLREFSLDLDDGDETLVYPLPDALFSQEHFPALTAMDISNLSDADEARLRAWREARRAERTKF